MDAKERDAVAVVNELGETIGVMTRKDMLDVAVHEPVQSQRATLQSTADSSNWGRAVAGHGNDEPASLGRTTLTSSLPDSPHVTVAGVIQESPATFTGHRGRCQWGPLQLEVTEVPRTARSGQPAPTARGGNP